MTRTPDLNAAYAVKTPDDNRALYGDWADTYDASFAQKTSYALPQHVATTFAAEGGQGPVLDVGAGTGLAAEALAGLGAYTIDALDLSPDMLAVARGKNIYRTCIEADLTKALHLPELYAGIISSGTFTHGHVGPDALDGLIHVAAPGALFVLSINANHFTARGFAAKFDTLAPRIKDFRIQTVRIYGEAADPEHAKDKGHLAVFHAV